MKLKLIFFTLFLFLEIVGYLFTARIKNIETGKIVENSVEINRILLNSILKSFQTDGELIASHIKDTLHEKNRAESINYFDNNFLYYFVKYGISSIKLELENGEILQFGEKEENSFKTTYKGVEIDFSLQAIRSRAMELLPHHYQFIIKGEKREGYTQTHLSEKFYIDTHSDNECYNPKYGENISKIDRVNSTLDVKTSLNRFEEFGVYLELNDTYFNISFIPMGQNVYFIAYEEDSKTIAKEYSIMYNRILLLTFFLAIIVSLAYLYFSKELKIRKLNQELQIRIDEEIKKSRKKDRLILQQSKLSAIGEMMNSIAHQWRQPLNRISLGMINIEEDFMYDELTHEALLQYSETINSSIQYLSRVIDDFREFYKPIAEQEAVDVSKLVRDLVDDLQDEYKEKIDIKLRVGFKCNHMVDYGRELKQVLLNLVNNSIDAILNSSIDGKIEMEMFELEENRILISILDNGGGIPKEIQERIFEPYFTTKFESEGTGMGLYVSKITIEVNMGGKLIYTPKESGSKFEIELFSH